MWINAFIVRTCFCIHYLTNHFFLISERSIRGKPGMAAQALRHMTEDYFREHARITSVINMVWTSLYIHFSLDLGLYCQFSFSRGVELVINKLFKNVQILVMKNFIVKTHFRLI